MLGQFLDKNHKQYNIIILAGGFGSRMGDSSEFIPKPLVSIGEERAIDILIRKFFLISYKIILGISWQAELLENYIKGKYPNKHIFFSIEHFTSLQNNAVSLMHALDHADSRFPTVVSFCDLLILSNNIIESDSLFIADKSTKGVVGTFRHGLNNNSSLIEYSKPSSIRKVDNGILGFFTFQNTYYLKKIVYEKFVNKKLNDITFDVVKEYMIKQNMTSVFVEKVLEFGTEQDLKKVRSYWEKE